MLDRLAVLSVDSIFLDSESIIGIQRSTAVMYIGAPILSCCSTTLEAWYTVALSISRSSDRGACLILNLFNKIEVSECLARITSCLLVFFNGFTPYSRWYVFAISSIRSLLSFIFVEFPYLFY